VLNTADYGVPQSRKRVFIVGMLKKDQKQEFEWPKPIPCRPLHEFVDWKNTKKHENITQRMMKIFKTLPTDSKFINLSFAKDTNLNTNTLCPTITSSGNIWCVQLQRYATVEELLTLQGFRKDFQLLCSPRKAKKFLGNTISVNVLVHIFKNIVRMIAQD
jgi:DNA (cytosine-5)-methyltransferase 1